MADITRFPPVRHLRGGATSWVRHMSGGTVRHEGVGLAFWFWPRTAVLSEVPIDDRELPLLFHARTADFADITVQATVTYRVASPELAAQRLDFGIHPASGLWTGQPLDQLATVLAELAQQPALDLVAGLGLADAVAAVTPVREAITAALAADPRLAEVGVTVVGVRVVAIRPEPELERALQTPTREGVQAEADRATYARRAQAVQRERAIAENELQNQIELARRQEQLVEQQGANSRREAELRSASELVKAQGVAERDMVAAQGAAERERLTSEAKAHAKRVVGAAAAEAEQAWVAAYADVPMALIAREISAKLPQIGALTITPDVVTALLEKLATGVPASAGAPAPGSQR
ncbi:MAG: SPFH domain-containing protein [Micromonosporaceae bacterium]